MKNFKKLSVGLLLGVGLVGSAFAENHRGLDPFENARGDIHAASAYQYHGYQFSDGNPSIGASLTIGGQSGLYGTIESNTVKLGDVKNMRQTQNALTIGYSQDVYGVTVTGGVTRNLFQGKEHISGLSDNEAFIGASYKGAYAKLSNVLSGANLGVPGFTSHDTYGELGYTYHIGKYNVGGDVGYSWYNNGGAKDGLSVAQVRAGYSLTNKIDLTVTHQFAGDDFAGNTSTGTHKTFVKVAYKF